jgi:hypothetical protein
MPRLKDIPKPLWLRSSAAHGLVQQHIEERRDMSDVKKTLVAQVDWFLVQHALWDHAQRNRVPARPECVPFSEGWDVARGSRRRGCGRRRGLQAVRGGV